MVSHYTFKSFVLLFLFTVSVAANSETLNGFNVKNSIIKQEMILSGGPPKGGIPALTDPEFVKVKNANWLDDDDRVLGVKVNGIAKAYPLSILNWHEVVNDKFDNKPVLVTYCPLCFSGVAFDPVINGQRYIFGVSGLLYDSDVLLYDKKTESLWSQLMSQAIAGELVQKKLDSIPLINTTWKDWRSRHPETMVLSLNTGYRRDYKRDPYIDYRKEPHTMFPVQFRSKGYHPKELVLGINVGSHYKAYPFSELSKSNGTIQDRIGFETVYIKYDKDSNSAYAANPACETIPAVTLFWFAWYTFNPDTVVYKHDSKPDSVSDIQC